MDYEDYLQFSEYAENTGLDPMSEEEYIQNLELDSEIDQYIDEIDFDGMHDLYGGVN